MTEKFATIVVSLVFLGQNEPDIRKLAAGLFSLLTLTVLWKDRR